MSWCEWNNCDKKCTVKQWNSLLFVNTAALQKVKFTPVYVMRRVVGGDVRIHLFLHTTLDGVEWSTSCPSHFFLW